MDAAQAHLEESKGEAVMPEETKRSPSITDCLAGQQPVSEAQE